MLSIALCGLGGYGEGFYLEPLLKGHEAGEWKLTATIDPFPERCILLQELRNKDIPIYPSLDAFYAAGKCDLTILSTPIHLHCQQTCMALEHGSHVLCEKPLCGSLEEMDRMTMAEKISGKTVTIGYQWSFSRAVQQLKADCLAGKLGRPRRMRALIGSRRDEAYYRRNNWAGAIRTPEGGWVLDSPVNNGTAHYLHNMLYILGTSTSESAVPERIEGDLWRANSTENYDTAALRIHVQGGAELLFLTSHATENNKGPLFSYEFDLARVDYDATHSSLLARFESGEEIDYGFPDADPLEKLRYAVDSALTGKTPVCGISAASAHTRCVVMAQSAAPIRDFPSSSVHTLVEGTNTRRYVEGLDAVMAHCYQEWKLFKEIDPGRIGLDLQVIRG